MDNNENSVNYCNLVENYKTSVKSNSELSNTRKTNELMSSTQRNEFIHIEWSNPPYQINDHTSEAYLVHYRVPQLILPLLDGSKIHLHVI